MIYVTGILTGQTYLTVTVPLERRTIKRWEMSHER